MKIDEVFNNQQKMYFNVLPPRNCKSTGSMIAAVMRAKADEMGNEDTEAAAEGQADKLWPNNKYDRRQYDDVGKSIIQQARLLRKKEMAREPKEMQITQGRDVPDSHGGIYR